MALRAVAACVLSAISTRESLNLLFSGFRHQPTDSLLSETTFSCWSPGPLAAWFVKAASEDTLVDFQEARDEGLHADVINFLCEVAVDSGRYAPGVRAIAMQGLYYYTQEYEGGIRATFKFPQDLYDSATELADDADAEVAGKALQLLAHISHRIESVPRTLAPKATKPRIDFNRADIAAVIRQYGPYRFADVHPEDFEKIVAHLFRHGGFDVQETSYVGDYGADLIVSKDTNKIAVQVKRYGVTSSVGVGDVNQVIGALRYYKCNRCLVITTSRFTKQAIDLAKRANVLLWDWDVLVEQINRVFGNCLTRG